MCKIRIYKNERFTFCLFLMKHDDAVWIARAFTPALATNKTQEPNNRRILLHTYVYDIHSSISSRM